MIPESVFNHMRYGTGARPGASLRIDDDVSYSLYRDNGLVCAKRYTVLSWHHCPYNGARIDELDVRIVPLGSVPDMPANRWDIYWTNES